eukprot:TRINITY_DN2120_c0_g1_i4.p1 TRINITY_DN2120_c0_g1~~TRINITY_DN2120_c0_g1_i4.p1  ORF type:complete len:395 (+),score=131.42 TRINITY_DN2120_c0_g1_i4:265-1449(+)
MEPGQEQEGQQWGSTPLPMEQGGGGGFVPQHQAYGGASGDVHQRHVHSSQPQHPQHPQHLQHPQTFQPAQPHPAQYPPEPHFQPSHAQAHAQGYGDGQQYANQAGAQGPGGMQQGAAGLFQDFAPHMGPTAQLGLEVGSKLMEGQMGYVNENISRASSYFDSLKYYFTVDTSYVAHKLQRLYTGAFAPAHTFRRAQDDDLLPPRDDINAPDLYIPLMAGVTFVLLVGYAFGTAYKFTPDVLYTTGLSAVVLTVLEALLLKLGLYVLASDAAAPFFDLLAYSGYNFVGVIVNMLAFLTFGLTAYYISWAVNGTFIAIFMWKTFQNLLRGGGSMERNFLVFVAVLQFLLPLILAWEILFLFSPHEAAAVAATVAAVPAVLDPAAVPDAATALLEPQ